MISVIILNWQRTDFVRQICARLQGYSLVDEVIVWNNNPDEHLLFDEPKVKSINTSCDMGLFTRFAAASLARNECVLYHDDDLHAPEQTLEQLYEQWRARPDVCHTLWGRNASAEGEYTTELFYGPVEIVLTRYTMTHRRACVHALSHTPRFADLPGVPVGNGEDIILSYAAMELSGRPNQAHRLPVTELGQDADVSIHKRYPQHMEHRTRIIRRCREVFKVRRALWRNRAGRRWLWFRKGVRRRLPAAVVSGAG